MPSPTQGRPTAAQALLLFGAAFAALAWAHGLRLDDDSYAHFAASVRILTDGNWRALVTDTWNKPLTALIYGPTGALGGLGLARTASVLLTVLAAFLVRGALERWLGWTPEEHVWFVPAFFLLQIGLLPQVFLTMTEQLAAALLAAALHLWARGRPRAAFLAAGFMPWARIESLFVAAALFVAMSAALRRAPGSRPLRQVALLNGLGALPFASWWAWGFLLTGDRAWMSASYAYLREPFWSNLWSTNAVTGLCGALGAAQVLLISLGLLAWRSAPRAGLPLGLLLLPAAAHLVFASLVVVYPRGSGFGGSAILALNARSYGTISPLFCLLAGWGWQQLFGGKASACGDRRSGRPWAAAALTALLIVGYAVFQGTFALFSPTVRIGQLALGLASLCGAAAIALSIGRLGCRRAAGLYAAFAIASAAAMAPFFWYPLLWQDRRAEAQRAFVRRLLLAPKPPPLVIQSLNGRLDFFAGGSSAPMRWTYPALAGRGAESAPAGSWIVLDTDERGKPTGYPAEVVRQLTDPRAYAPAGSFVDTRPRPGWQRLIDRLTPRNRGGGWLIVEKLAPAP